MNFLAWIHKEQTLWYKTVNWMDFYKTLALLHPSRSKLCKTLILLKIHNKIHKIFLKFHPDHILEMLLWWKEFNKIKEDFFFKEKSLNIQVWKGLFMGLKDKAFIQKLTKIPPTLYKICKNLSSLLMFLNIFSKKFKIIWTPQIIIKKLYKNPKQKEKLKKESLLNFQIKIKMISTPIQIISLTPVNHFLLLHLKSHKDLYKASFLKN